MHVDEVRQLVTATLEGRRLLAHPFYRRWDAGALNRDELARYAEQYRVVEGALPGVLETVAEGMDEGAARELVTQNLADERGRPVPHVELFEQFARAVGAATETVPGDAAAALVAQQRSAAATSPAAGIASLAAYEVQAAEIARTKSEGLRRHYGADRWATRFWDVHAAIEAEHAAWSLEALAELAADGGAVVDSVDLAAQAWWDFLDEREAGAAS